MSSFLDKLKEESKGFLEITKEPPKFTNPYSPEETLRIKTERLRLEREGMPADAIAAKKAFIEIVVPSIVISRIEAGNINFSLVKEKEVKPPKPPKPPKPLSKIAINKELKRIALKGAMGDLTEEEQAFIAQHGMRL